MRQLFLLSVRKGAVNEQAQILPHSFPSKSVHKISPLEKNVGPRGPIIPYFQFHILDEEERKSLNVRALAVLSVNLFP
jgi:hypothetical protein